MPIAPGSKAGRGLSRSVVKSDDRDVVGQGWLPSPAVASAACTMSERWPFWFAHSAVEEVREETNWPVPTIAEDCWPMGLASELGLALWLRVRVPVGAPPGRCPDGEHANGGDADDEGLAEHELFRCWMRLGLTQHSVLLYRRAMRYAIGTSACTYLPSN